MQPFAYEAPATLPDALGLLARHGEEARVLAGGQSLVPLLGYRLARPRVVVDVNGLPLAGLEDAGGRLRLGALVRHHQLEESPRIRRRCPVLAEAAGLVGNVRVRTLGTVGGSLAHADPAAELPAVIVALDAVLALVSAAGTRAVAARDFFTGPLATALGHGELLAGVEVPALEGRGWAVEEFARRAGDFALVAVVAVVGIDRRGRVEEARLALGGVGPTPVRMPAAEEALLGREPVAERLAEVARAVRERLDPQTDAFASGAYRRHLAGVLARRALARAVSRAIGADGASTARSEVSPGETAPAEPALEPRDRPSGPPASRYVINGRAREVEARADETLLEMLRDRLGIFDVKEGCGEGVCGACTVLLDGRPVSSCLLLARSVRGRAVRTVRGLQDDGELHPLQEAFIRHGAVQCGFCTPGMLLTTLAFLARQPRPTREQIRGALEGNLCRCTGYAKILDAVEAYVREASRG